MLLSDMAGMSARALDPLRLGQCSIRDRLGEAVEPGRHLVREEAGMAVELSSFSQADLSPSEPLLSSMRTVQMQVQRVVEAGAESSSSRRKPQLRMPEHYRRTDQTAVPPRFGVAPAAAAAAD